MNYETMKSDTKSNDVVDASLKLAQGDSGETLQRSILAFAEKLEFANPEHRLPLLRELYNAANSANSIADSKCKSGAGYRQHIFLDATVEKTEDGQAEALVDADLVVSSQECGSTNDQTRTMLRLDLFNNHSKGKHYDGLQLERSKKDFNLENPYSHFSLTEQIYNWLWPSNRIEISHTDQIVFRQKNMSPLYNDHSRKSLLVAYLTPEKNRKIWSENTDTENSNDNSAKLS